MRTAPVTFALAAVTVLVSLFVTLTGYDVYAALAGGVIPARLSADIVFPPDVFAVPAWLTPLSATLLHAGFAHLAFNMLLLLVTGRACELALGGRRMLLLYGIGAYAAAALQWALAPGSAIPMIGASGAISAFLAAYAVLFGRSRARAIGPVPADAVNLLWLAAAWTGINLLAAPVFASAGVPIAAGAHIGGFIAGLVLARPLASR